MLVAESFARKDLITKDMISSYSQVVICSKSDPKLNRVPTTDFAITWNW